MGADRASGQDRRVLGFHSPDLDLRIVLPEDFADTRQGTAGPDAAAETVDGSSHLVQDLLRGEILLCHCIIGIGELLRYKHPGIFFLHAQRRLQALIDAGADITGVMDQPDLCPVMTDELGALLTDRVRHDDDRAVSPDSTDQRQADPLVSARGFHNDRVGTDDSLFFRLHDHVERGPRLDGSAHIEPFDLDQYPGTARFGHSLQLHHGRISDGFQNVIINHNPFSPVKFFC